MSAANMQEGRATLVLSGGERGVLDWAGAEASDSRVIAVWNLNLLSDSLHLAEGPIDVEVVRVIFDQSIDAEEWLEFLTAMPHGFRGDVLMVIAPDKAYLSAVGRSDERVVYRLTGQDIRFYLEMAGIEAGKSQQLSLSGFDYEPALRVAV